MAALHGTPRGVVTPGLSPSISSTLLRTLATRLADLHPHISLRIEEAFSGNVAEWLRDGRVDLAIVYQDQSSKCFASVALLTEELVLVHHPDVRRQVRSTQRRSRRSRSPCRRSHGLRGLVEAGLAAYDLRPEVRFELDSLLMLKGWRWREPAATVLPRAAVSAEVAANMLATTAIETPALHRVMVQAMANGKPLDAARRAVFRTIREVAAEHADGGTDRPRE